MYTTTNYHTTDKHLVNRSRIIRTAERTPNQPRVICRNDTADNRIRPSNAHEDSQQNRKAMETVYRLLCETPALVIAVIMQPQPRRQAQRKRRETNTACQRHQVRKDRNRLRNDER